MFKIGDKVKINLAAVDSECSEWKGSQVYDNMMKAANEKRFEIAGDDGNNYIIRRLDDGNEMPYNKQKTHSSFELAND